MVRTPSERQDFRSPRLHVGVPLAAGVEIALEKSQANYPCNLLRLTAGDAILVFTGRDGEWRAALSAPGKRATLAVLEQTRPQTAPADLHYLFAPLKHERLDYMMQKAVEMGVSHLQPVLTRHTQVSRVNLDRMRANAIEAAEQCGILAIPTVGEPLPLARALEARDAGRVLVFCDEDAEISDPVAALAAKRPRPSALLPPGETATPLAVLIGPEGGFAEDERALLLAQPNILRLSLGPRILRADTAAVAALALAQAVLGDWR